MKRKSFMTLSFRMAITLFVMLLTSVGAWADRTPVSLSGNATDGYYINMPEKGTAERLWDAAELTLDGSITTFKIYDDGGKDNPHSQFYYGHLILVAPEGKTFKISGTVTAQGNNNGTLHIYEDEENNNFLTKLGKFDTPGGEAVDVTASQRFVDIYFYTGYKIYEGLDLTVTLVDQPEPILPISVSYVDENGVTKSVNATVLTGNEEYIQGWYAVVNDIVFAKDLKMLGETHLILCDGCTMTMGTEEIPVSSGDAAIWGGTGLFIYGQSEQTGKLNIVSKGIPSIYVNYYAQFGGKVNVKALCSESKYPDAIKAKDHVKIRDGSLDVVSESARGIRIESNVEGKAYEQTGGAVNISSDQTCLMVYDGASKITGGSLIAEVTSTNSNAISVYGDISITGGNVRAVTKNIVWNDGISAERNLTLGWTKPTDRIYASSYGYNCINIADGQYMTDGTEVYNGDLTGNNFAANANGKTLRPTRFRGGNGSAGKPYIISDAEGWNDFCDYLEDVDTWNYFRGKTVKLGADIEVSRVAGSSKHDFSGTFDGAGHKLTVNLTGTGNYTAPFYYLKPQSDDESVTIRGLKVDGTINTAYKYAGGLVGGCHGKVNIIDCVSDVTINSSVSGDGTHGGLVGRMASSGTLSFDGCAFTGKMLTTNGTANCGGFLGWTVGTVNINNCLYAPAAMEDGETEVGSSESKAFARLNNTAVMNINNSFYTRTLGTAQGIQARSTATLPSNIGEAGEDYRFVKAYAKGLKCNDLYYMVPEALTLANASANDVESISGYFADVTLADRSLTKDGTWNTLCLPFSLNAEQIEGSPLAGATIKEMDSSTNLSSDGLLTLNFKNAESIEAGKAYIVKWETTGENIVNPVFNGVTVSNAALTESLSGDEKVKFVGQYSPFTIDENNIHEILFIGSGNKIGYSKNPRSLKSCRAHFWVKPNGNSASARVINLDLGDGVTTRIDLVEAKEDSNSESGMYTLDGRKLQNEPTQKGVYIKNGKKIIK